MNAIDTVAAIWPAFNATLEARINHMYLDCKGLVTCAIGNLLRTPEQAIQIDWHHADGSLATPLQVIAEWQNISKLEPNRIPSYYARHATLHLLPHTIDALVTGTFYEFVDYTRQYFPIDTWPADAVAGAMSRAWGAGPDLTNWPKFTQACLARYWLTAGIESKLREDNNPGVVPRNARQQALFHNAYIVERDDMLPDMLYYPRVL